MSDNPEQIRAQTQQTRSELSANVNALGEAASPGNVARRQVSKVAGAAAGLRDKVMGTAADAKDSVASASDLQAQAGDVTAQAKRKAQGNPLAAGLIALGAGWLLGSLLPASEKETQLASAAKEQAQPLVSEAKSVAQESAENLKEPTKEAAQTVKESAQGAVENVKAQGQKAKDDVQASAADAKDTVQQQNQTP